jgi:hypothetical protein
LRRAGLVFFALSFVACLALAAQPAWAQPAPDFGSPPSGAYPILFNDHHVYAKPDVNRQGRVLAALVRGKTILVPLRSLFEQMGATVSYDPKSRTAIVSKPGSEVSVTVGKPEVVINGESRPLDVPPVIYEGAVLVPLRVLSEGMGAYVQWVPEKRTVVVRYVAAPPPTPPPAPATAAPSPTASPVPILTPIPVPTPSPAPTPYYDKFIVGDAIIQPQVWNEFTPGNTTMKPWSWNAHAAWEPPIDLIHIMVEADWHHWVWVHPTGNVNILGGGGSVFSPQFVGRDNDADLDFGIRIAQPRIYFIEGFLWTWNDYGYPPLRGIGYGLEKLPDLNQSLSLYGKLWYSSLIKGNYPAFTVGTTGFPSARLSYQVVKWSAGVDWNLPIKFPIFLDAGIQGEVWTPLSGAPAGRNEWGPAAGLGIRLP